jgi:hypothetical protein
VVPYCCEPPPYCCELPVPVFDSLVIVASPETVEPPADPDAPTVVDDVTGGGVIGVPEPAGRFGSGSGRSLRVAIQSSFIDSEERGEKPETTFAALLTVLFPVNEDDRHDLLAVPLGTEPRTDFVNHVLCLFIEAAA